MISLHLLKIRISSKNLTEARSPSIDGFGMKLTGNTAAAMPPCFMATFLASTRSPVLVAATSYNFDAEIPGYRCTL
jgi:hypothetical protein